MTIWAILSDVHGRGDKLARALADAQRQGASRILALGDIGSTCALDMLNDAGAECIFGNWEASGLRGLPASYRGWITRWRPRLCTDGIWAAHASPIWPDGLDATGVVGYLREGGLHWSALFPSLQHSEDARWAALAELAAADVHLFFHGHTHVQEAWCWIPGSAPARVAGAGFTLGDGERWLAGVGSVGDPHDGGGICYALYEVEARCVVWRRL